MGELENLTGKRFGRLTVVGLSNSRIVESGVLHYWLCKCDCGKTKSILNKTLKAGAAKSCGCLRRELAASKKTTHGKSYTKEYFCYMNMLRRCYDKKDKRYANYGGRGITVCERWIQSFENFYSDMGDAPSHKHSIDRVDVNGVYSKENCRWATIEEQAINKRSSLGLKLNGLPVSARKYCAENGISYNTFRYRLDVLGWTLEEAVCSHDGRRVRRQNR